MGIADGRRMSAETLGVCATCGKMGGSCRWSDDAELCMRKQLDALRAALATIVQYCDVYGAAGATKGHQWAADTAKEALNG